MRPTLSLLPLLAALAACDPGPSVDPLAPAHDGPPAAAPTPDPAPAAAAKPDPKSLEAAVVGTQAGDWQGVRWLDAAPADLSEGTTLVLFWEAWCPHCRRELPEVATLERSWRDRGLQVVGLTRMSRGVEEAQVRELMASSQVEFPVGQQDGVLSERFAVRGVPAAALVHDGEVVWRGHPARLDEALIGKALGDS